MTSGSRLRYPPTPRGRVVEVLHGRQVADPYRWLEDPDSPETTGWVAAQNALTEEYLADLPQRRWFAETMAAILRRPRTGVPFSRAGRWLVARNDGRQDQDVWYVANSLAELIEDGRVLIDPNTFAAGGTDSVGSLTVSPDGRLVCYGHSEGGSDWQTFVLLDPDTGEQVPDARIQTKFSEAVWLPDARSYLYVDFTHDGHADGTQPTALGRGRLRLHRLGQPPSDDRLVLEFADNDRLMMWPELSHDRRWVIVSILEGTESRNRLWVYPVLEQAGPSRLGDPIQLIDTPVAQFGFIRVAGSRLLLRTDLDAPRGRIVSCDLATYERTGLAEFIDLVPEGDDTLEFACAAGDTMLVGLLRDAAPLLRRHALDGSSLGDVPVPGGAVVGLFAEADEPDVLVGMSSVTSPAEVFRVEAATGVVRALPELVRGEDPFDVPEVRIERRRATSEDGTPVPYFLIVPSRAAGLEGPDGQHEVDGPRPTLLWGYGGFNVPIAAEYRPGWPGWLAAGGVLAIANLRGGGEFGTQWYEQGRLAAKQNVFDDAAAVAQDLMETGVTGSRQLAIHGRSNGGLLVSALITQRPELFAAAVPAVGVLDLLRFHLFTIGAAWISDYGNPDDPTQFEDALAYSPLHNVRPGTSYPATLVLTGDHDDRVVPLHSHKFTATLQHAQAGAAPVLTRIETATGHGAGKPAAMVAAEWADLLTFCAHHTGLRVG